MSAPRTAGRSPWRTPPLGLALVGALLLGGCAQAPPPTTTAAPALAVAPAEAPPVSTLTPSSAMLATLRQDVGVSPMPGARAASTLPARTALGSPTVLPVTDDDGDWLRVLLPGRPNGGVGWIPAAEVDLSSTDWRVEVSLTAHRLRVFRGLLQVAEHPVGVGKAVTPTPRGTWFVTDLLRPPDPSGPYGPFAFGLSAYSEVLTSFAGGDGQIGLHGTDAPEGLGQDVSHGCLRLSNEVVQDLAAQLPLGTPVVVSA